MADHGTEMDITDQELITASRAGDLDAFSSLVKRYHGHVRACLAVRLDDGHEAEDLAQDAFVTAYHKLHEFDLDRPFGPWVRTIAFNRLRNHWRKHRAEPVGGNEELKSLVDEQIGLQHSVDYESDTLVALRTCLGKLPNTMRELLELRYNQGLAVAELTERQGCNHSTLTMRLHRMREQLRLCIADQIASQRI
jgi:RNA polymerase sigma-70 factor (ECF subfamily)